MFRSWCSSAAFAQSAPAHFGFGTPVTPAGSAGVFFYPADGRGLPSGSGNAAAGAKIYAEKLRCLSWRQAAGQSRTRASAATLVGGRGSLATKTPVKTVESYWPYATTLFDYVKRAMPFNSPGSLKDDELYAVVAYILSEAKIIQPTETDGRSDVAEGGHAKPRRLRAGPSAGA